MEQEQFRFEPQPLKELKPLVPQFIQPPKETRFEQRRFMMRNPRDGRK